MKLLKPKEIKREKRKELHKEVVLAQKVEKVTQQKRKELNAVKSNYMSEKEILDIDFKVFLENHYAEKGKLVNEIGTLEARREAAMKPVDQLMEEVKEEKANLVKLTKETEARQDSQDVRDAHLHARKVTLSEKEESLMERKVNLNLRESNIEEKESEILIKDTNLSKSIEEHSKRIGLEKAEVISKVKYLEEKEKSLNREREGLREKDRKLDVTRLQLEDQRKTLERALKR